MPKRNARPVLFLAMLGVGMLLGTALWIPLINHVGRGYCLYSFVPKYHLYKMERLKRAASPKIVFLGGSSAQESILPDVVAHEMGMDVVLAGTIWEIPMAYFPSMLGDALREGDILYLALEHTYYTCKREDLLSPFCVSMLLGVDPSLRSALDFDEVCSLYLTKGLGWLQCTLPKRFPSRQYERYNAKGLYQIVQSYPGSKSLDGLGSYGEDTCNCPVGFDEDRTHSLPSGFSEEFYRVFGKIRELVRNRKARLIVGNVNCYSYPRDLGTGAFLREQAKLGVPVCCSPLEMCLPYGFYSDAPLHCNKAGKRYVTHQVVKGLKRILKRKVAPEPCPLNFFSAGEPHSISFDLPDVCVGRETFGEFIVDRGSAGQTSVVRRLKVNGREVPFEERIHAARNTLWTHWNAAKRCAVVEIEFEDGRSDCRGERVLVEPYRFDELRALHAFNDIRGFAGDPGHLGRYVGQGDDGHLFFRIPNWNSNRYCFRVKVRMDAGIGGFFWGGEKTGGWVDRKARTRDGVTELKIVPNESDGFVDGRGDAVFGLRFNALPVGAVVELLSCEVTMI